ncbi:glycoside hydrolase family 92 protein [Pleurotus ostreatus PC15]|uniref:Glycoside hydrolase family 92 protein n=1 Tax=Pleurotus ostreatus (strain PC15) TaxID=1137138 RepID=A0A067NL54_PLEO1|nr:glycoside hydrolase family 92 protein [Pleurotus ostreatus PC15]
MLADVSIYLLSFLLSVGSAALAKAVPPAFRRPASDAVDHVDPIIGNGGVIPSHTGGMIPSTAPPFAMTRWVAQTRQNYVSVPPYILTDTSIHGFQGTHQPAIWMGESGQVIVVPGAGNIKSKFEDRGMTFDKGTEVRTASYYSVELDALGGGTILAEQSATSRVGHLRFTFQHTSTPYVIVEATRAAVVGHTDTTNTTLHIGSIRIDPHAREICGSNPERQDSIIGPLSTPARGFSGYFCARFAQPFASWGVATNGTTHAGVTRRDDQLLSGFATFAPFTKVVDVRIGVSFISIEQARRNLDREIPDGETLEATARKTRSTVAWAEKLDRVQLEGATEKQKTIFYTGFFHSLQYPYETSEEGRYYSGFDDQVHQGDSYNGYSIWDTFRAEWAWLIIFAPERMPGMITSMLNDFKEGGWLPKWKNIVETNIMVGTHADSQISEAVVKGVRGFDLELAWQAVVKDASVPPVDDNTTIYGDRQENVDYEVRSGLSTVYAQNGWVASDIHSEAGSCTLDYSYDDYAISLFADVLNKTEDAQFYRDRGLGNPFKIFNDATGFMEARDANGSFAGPDAGWTEGDKWIYTFDVVQNIPELARRRGGNASFVQFLDEHFDGGHNQHTNEPSHHIPYLYALVNASSKTQERVRSIAVTDYDDTPTGLLGNEDCGQMSAWYLFSALGFYPVDPASGNYVIGSPFFDKATIRLPGVARPLVISSPGAPSQIYVKTSVINGEKISNSIIAHEQLIHGGELQFEMSLVVV